MAESERPLSPHLGIYKWQISNSLSILHRMTGVLMSVGALLLVTWLVAASAGGGPYAAVITLLRSPLGLLMLLGWSFSFFYHLGNGIRHLAWDMGYGFGKQTARNSGWLVLLFALAATAVLWSVVLTASGAPV